MGERHSHEKTPHKGPLRSKGGKWNAAFLSSKKGDFSIEKGFEQGVGWGGEKRPKREGKKRRL